MRFTARIALLLVAALLAAVVVTGLGSATGLAPQAAACEKHKKEDGRCPGPGTPENPSGDLAIRGTLITEGPISAITYTVDARLVGGQASGTASIDAGPVNNPSGTVLEIVLPGAGRDFYCVNFENNPDSGIESNRYNIYFRDNGNGLLTHDDVGFSGMDGIDCSTPGEPSPSTAGDFKVTKS